MLHRLGAFALLLNTPLKVEDILRGQFFAQRRMFGLALLSTGLMTLAILLLARLGEPNWDSEDQTVIVALAVAATAALGADAYMVTWLASWRSHSARRYQSAAGNAVFRVLVLPWVILLVLLPIMPPNGFWQVLFFWALIGLLSCSLWTVYARSRLSNEFRAAAAGTLTPRPGSAA